MESNWENVWGIFGILLLVVVVTLLVSLIVADKPVLRYYLDGSMGSLTISADIPWGEDKSFDLDRSVTYERAIAIVDSLNAELLRHPRLQP